MTLTRDTGLAARLLRTERDALLPILRRTPAEAFDRPTVCSGWSVRDVLAHCACALIRVAENRLHDFSPEANEADIAERRPLPLGAVLAELERGYLLAVPVVTAAGGRLDGMALGEWVHGGDVRDALGEPGAYESPGSDDALVLLLERSRRLGLPATAVTLRGLGGLPGRALDLGAHAEDGSRATLVTDLPTLIRLCAGRNPNPARFTLEGADPSQYTLFG